jgi:hypothetical protein
MFKAKREKKVLLMADNSNAHYGTVQMHGQNARFSYPNWENMYGNDFYIIAKHIAGSIPPANSIFWRKMADAGYIVHAYERKYNHKTGLLHEKSVDSAIIANGIEALIELKPDILAILGGDLDMLPLIEKAKERDVEVHVWSYQNAISRELREAADGFYAIDEYLDDLVFFQNPGGNCEKYVDYMTRITNEENDAAQRQADFERDRRESDLRNKVDDLFEEMKKQERLRQEERDEWERMKQDYIDESDKTDKSELKTWQKVGLVALVVLCAPIAFAVGYKKGEDSFLD